MTSRAAMAELKAAGTAQNRKVYARHGYPADRTFGVSFATLGALAKRAGIDQTLAGALWDSGNADAQLLACMIADPDRISSKQLDAWAKQVDFYPLADGLAKLTAKTPFIGAKLTQWTKSKQDHTGQAGWTLLSLVALNDSELPDSFFAPYLKTIETGIHKAANRTRHSMNQALIAIGTRNPELTGKALQIAAKIGNVEVDHGETSCQTPDAAAYIHKTLAYRAKKLAQPQLASKKAGVKKIAQKAAKKKSTAKKKLRTRPQR